MPRCASASAAAACTAAGPPGARRPTSAATRARALPSAIVQAPLHRSHTGRANQACSACICLVESLQAQCAARSRWKRTADAGTESLVCGPRQTGARAAVPWTGTGLTRALSQANACAKAAPCGLHVVSSKRAGRVRERRGPPARRQRPWRRSKAALLQKPARSAFQACQPAGHARVAALLAPHLQLNSLGRCS